MKKATELGALAVSRLKQPGLHFVGGVTGLGLRVLPTGAKHWVLRATIGDKRCDMGLGVFPDVTLAMARDAARDARSLIRAGKDPIAERKALRSALRASTAKVMTFKECAEAYIAAHEAGWKNAAHRDQWRATLANYAYPEIGSLSVRDVETAHVMAILKPIWHEKTETAKRLRGRLELVLDSATAAGYREGLNPARWKGHLAHMLAAPGKITKVKHHAALPVADMGGFMKELRRVEGIGARALEFAILTAARSGEVRGAVWSEFDLNAKVWTIPATRMKAGREHRVALSAVAVKLLKGLPRIVGTDLIFAAPRGGMLSDMTLSAVTRRMGVNAVPHGIARSTFSDWATSWANYPPHIVEMALAHAIENRVEAAYRRDDLLEKRRPLMADWAAFCSQIEGENVIAIEREKISA